MADLRAKQDQHSKSTLSSPPLWRFGVARPHPSLWHTKWASLNPLTAGSAMTICHAQNLMGVWWVPIQALSLDSVRLSSQDQVVRLSQVSSGSDSHLPLASRVNCTAGLEDSFSMSENVANSWILVLKTFALKSASPVAIYPFSFHINDFNYSVSIYSRHSWSITWHYTYSDYRKKWQYALYHPSQPMLGRSLSSTLWKMLQWVPWMSHQISFSIFILAPSFILRLSITSHWLIA